MALERRSNKPAAITNADGQPHIVVEIAGLTISSAPPAAGAALDRADEPRRPSRGARRARGMSTDPAETTP